MAKSYRPPLGEVKVCLIMNDLTTNEKMYIQQYTTLVTTRIE